MTFLWKALEDAKTDTTSAMTLYKNNQMYANATKFHYMHTSMDIDKYFQCEDINIKSDDIVKICNSSLMYILEVIQKKCIPI